MLSFLETFFQALIVELQDECKIFHAFFILVQEYVGDIVAEKLVLVETRTMQAYLGLSNSLFRSLLDLIMKFTLGSRCVGNKTFIIAGMERH